MNGFIRMKVKCGQPANDEQLKPKTDLIVIHKPDLTKFRRNNLVSAIGNLLFPVNIDLW